MRSVATWMDSAGVASKRIIAPAVEREIKAKMAGEGHLAQRGEGTAVAAVVVREQQLVLARLVDEGDEILEPLRVVKVGGSATEGVEALREDRAAQALLAGTQADQPQLGIDAALQVGRELRAHVGHAGEGGDDQRYRRDRLLRAAIDRVLRLHRQGKAHGDKCNCFSHSRWY